MARKLPEVDPLSFLPIRYEDRRTVVPVGRFKEGEEIMTEGQPRNITVGPKVTTVTMMGPGGMFFVKFFNMPRYYETIFSPGNSRRVIIWGAPKLEQGNIWCFYHPSLLKREDIGRVVPVYKTPSGISVGRLSDHVRNTADEMAGALNDEVPVEVLGKRGLPSISDAVRMIHCPEKLPDEKPLLRLAYRELFALKKMILEFPKQAAPVVDADISPFVNNLPWPLTPDQKKAIGEVIEDMKAGTAMRRILVGDVGCGKTEVAMAAAYAASQCGYRTLVLSPTTVLATQTCSRFKAFLGEDKVSLYTGEDKENPSLIVVGTHAILNKKFSGVGLVVLDEQHKYGVAQRQKLIDYAHALQLTATPIPRTMGRLYKGALELSVIENAPYRREVTTKVVSKADTPAVLRHIREVTDAGGKALVIYPLVDAESEHYRAVENVRDTWEQIYPGHVLYVHGRLDDKLEIVQEFRTAPDKKVLVATSLIETGVDIPEASILVVAGAERFGLAQLHQLRGRIGRRGNRSTCYFMFKKEGSGERLKPLENISDGFKLAELDSDERGWGSAFGFSQSGNCYKLPDLNLYKKVIGWVNEDARFLLCDRLVGAAR